MQTHPGLAAVDMEAAPEADMPQEQWSLQELERIEAEQVMSHLPPLTCLWHFCPYFVR